MSIEIGKIKESVQFFAKTLTAVVEEKLGDRSQVEEQMREQVRSLASIFGGGKRVEPVVIKVKSLFHFQGEVPKYETRGASGVDIRACLKSSVEIKPGERVMIPTGISMAIPEGFEIQVRPRSGLAIKQGLTVLNSPGTIDADYRGEVKIVVINLGQEPIIINNQERIAQLVVCPVVQAEFSVVESLDDTERGEGGFGSTGV